MQIKETKEPLGRDAAKLERRALCIYLFIFFILCPMCVNNRCY